MSTAAKRSREECGRERSTPPEYCAIEAAAKDIRVQLIESDSSDTEPDVIAEPPGAGPKGVGSSMMVGRGGKARPLTDGAGLCSQGQWYPRRRPVQRRHRRLSIRSALRRTVLRFKEAEPGSRRSEQWKGQGLQLGQSGRLQVQVKQVACAGRPHEIRFKYRE